jgi:hypothetical protein
MRTSGDSIVATSVSTVCISATTARNTSIDKASTVIQQIQSTYGKDNEITDK